MATLSQITIANPASSAAIAADSQYNAVVATLANLKSLMLLGSSGVNPPELRCSIYTRNAFTANTGATDLAAIDAACLYYDTAYKQQTCASGSSTTSTTTSLPTNTLATIDTAGNITATSGTPFHSGMVGMAISGFSATGGQIIPSGAVIKTFTDSTHIVIAKADLSAIVTVASTANVGLFIGPAYGGTALTA